MNFKVLFLTLFAIIKERYYINPIYLMAVFHHETGNFSSNIFKENNNLSGMKPSTRDNHTGENRGHATYKNVWKSIVDYIQRQKQFNVDYRLTLESYLDRTQATGYAEDSNYKLKVLNMYRQVKGRYAVPFLIVVPALAVAIYLIYKQLNK